MYICATVQRRTGAYICTYVHVQWNLSIEDTTGTQLVVMIREVTLNSEVDLWTARCHWDC